LANNEFRIACRGKLVVERQDERAELLATGAGESEPPAVRRERRIAISKALLWRVGQFPPIPGIRREEEERQSFAGLFINYNNRLRIGGPTKVTVMERNAAAEARGWSCYVRKTLLAPAQWGNTVQVRAAVTTLAEKRDPASVG
jgi:hypothetical protein